MLTQRFFSHPSLQSAARRTLSTSVGSEFVYSKHPDNEFVAVLTMDRPKAKNALGKDMMVGQKRVRGVRGL